MEVLGIAKAGGLSGVISGINTSVVASG